MKECRFFSSILLAHVFKISFNFLLYVSDGGISLEKNLYFKRSADTVGLFLVAEKHSMHKNKYNKDIFCCYKFLKGSCVQWFLLYYAFLFEKREKEKKKKKLPLVAFLGLSVIVEFQ